MMADGRLCALIVAYGYGPHDVSESYTSYALVREIARRHSVTVLTADEVHGEPASGGQANGASQANRGGPAVAGVLANAESQGNGQGPVSEARPAERNPRLVSIPVARRWLPQGIRRSLKPDYFEFNVKAYRLARQGTFGTIDVCQHVSPISLRYPDLLARLQAPFIWGPVGGSVDYPPGFEDTARRESLIYRLRGIDSLRLRADPTLRDTMARAARIVVTSTDAVQVIPERFRDKAVVIGEGVDVTGIAGTSSQASEDLPPFVMSSARLVPSKGMDFLLRAFARTPIPRLLITGSGPEHENLQRLAGELGITERVHFAGAVAKQENLRLMEQASFCVFPSLKEAFGHVNVEAMAKGKAVIAVGHGGPKDIVVDGVTGLLAWPTGPQALVEQLAAAMMRLYDNPSLCARLGRAAFDRALSVYDWRAIGRRYLALYEEVFDERF